MLICAQTRVIAKSKQGVKLQQMDREVSYFEDLKLNRLVIYLIVNHLRTTSYCLHLKQVKRELSNSLRIRNLFSLMLMLQSLGHLRRDRSR